MRWKRTRALALRLPAAANLQSCPVHGLSPLCRLGVAGQLAGAGLSAQLPGCVRRGARVPGGGRLAAGDAGAGGDAAGEERHGAPWVGPRPSAARTH